MMKIFRSQKLKKFLEDPEAKSNKKRTNKMKKRTRVELQLSEFLTVREVVFFTLGIKSRRPQ